MDGDYRDPTTFQALRKELKDAQRPAHYLAIPPVLFGAVVEQLVKSGCAKGSRVVFHALALSHLYLFYGDSFKVECPTGSGREMNLFHVAREISRRLVGIFLRDSEGRRPLYGATEKFQTDPYWRDHLIFPEYFHGDTGVAVGASHQTGWTGLVAELVQLRGSIDPAQVLKEGKKGAFVRNSVGEPKEKK